MKMVRKQRNLLKIWCIVLAIISTKCTGQESDWLQNCGRCSCTWKDGKKTVDCKSNSFSEIPTNLSPDVQVIDLSNNSIRQIKKDNFIEANLKNLHKIFMRNCFLEKIHKDAFKELAVLIELDLSNNLIENIPNGIFKDLEKLRILILNNNSIKILPQYILSNLPFLSRVEINDNNLSTIQPYAFNNVSSLTLIYLDNNSLSVLEKDIFVNMPKLLYLSLLNNPWNCSCDLKEFKDFAIQRNLYTPSTTCQEPANLKNVRWDEINSDNFACQPYVLYPVNNYKIEVTSPDSILIKCRVRGTPKVDLNWIHQNKILYSTKNNIIEQKKYQVRNTYSTDSQNTLVSEMKIYNISHSDLGEYICKVNNTGGVAETNIILYTSSNGSPIITPNNIMTSTNSMAFISVVLIITIVILALIGFIFCVYWRVRCRSKDIKSSNGRKHPVLHSSVIVDMQGKTDLLDESIQLSKQRNGSIEIVKQSHNIEQPKPRSNHYDYQHLPTQYQVDSALPPDLLSFPTYSTLRSIPKDSISVQLPHDYSFASTKENSPIYNRYVTAPNPNYIRPANRVHSPFNQAPIIYSPLVVKQQYMTIPRKSRANTTWAYPSCSPSPSGITSSSTRRQSASDYMVEAEPVYDNLGLRTTAGGNSSLNLQKSTPNKYSISMKDRPLPETPLLSKEHDNNLKIYEPIHELKNSGISGDNAILPPKLASRLPPKPPPKPKKSLNLVPKCEFDDEDDNGTEV